MAPRLRHSKYHAIPTMVDGIKFPSRAEARRYAELKLLQKAGEIWDLELQPKLPLLVLVLATRHGANLVECVGHYRADFSYQTKAGRVLEDVKGVRTPVYKLKKRLVEATYGVQIVEVP